MLKIQTLNSFFIIILSVSLLVACGNDDERVQDGLLTPDVTSIGIGMHIAKYYTMWSDDDVKEYAYKYSNDNRVNSFYGDGWSLSLSPLEFNNGRQSLKNFLLNDAGCTVYFERFTDGNVNARFILTYDSNNNLVSVKSQDVTGEETYKIIRSADGKITETQKYAEDGVLYETCTFTYGSSPVYNIDRNFVVPLISDYCFLAPIGLLGRPDKYLPSQCKSVTKTKNGSSTMNAKYDYEMQNGHIRQIKESWTWPDEGLQWAFFTSYMYKGLYDFDINKEDK